jgi:hypothetical protein
MADQKPTLEYGRANRKRPWWIDLPLVIVAGLVGFILLWLLVSFVIAAFAGGYW